MKHFKKIVLTLVLTLNLNADISNPTIGEITMFGGNFAPRNWALCQGQLLPISQYTALFSILGTTYGGDGRTTFALPDLRGRVPVSQGNGPGLSSRSLGQKGGAETVTLTTSHLPSHKHLIYATTNTATTASPSGTMHATTTPNPIGVQTYSTDTTAKVALHTDTIGNTGSSQAVSTIPPFLSINFIIALQGIFPSRN